MPACARCYERCFHPSPDVTCIAQLDSCAKKGLEQLVSTSNFRRFVAQIAALTSFGLILRNRSGVLAASALHQLRRLFQTDAIVNGLLPLVFTRISYRQAL